MTHDDDDIMTSVTAGAPADIDDHDAYINNDI